MDIKHGINSLRSEMKSEDGTSSEGTDDKCGLHREFGLSTSGVNVKHEHPGNDGCSNNASNQTYVLLGRSAKLEPRQQFPNKRELKSENKCQGEGTDDKCGLHREFGLSTSGMNVKHEHPGDHDCSNHASNQTYVLLGRSAKLEPHQQFPNKIELKSESKCQVKQDVASHISPVNNMSKFERNEGELGGYCFVTIVPKVESSDKRDIERQPENLDNDISLKTGSLTDGSCNAREAQELAPEYSPLKSPRENCVPDNTCSGTPDNQLTDASALKGAANIDNKNEVCSDDEGSCTTNSSSKQNELNPSKHCYTCEHCGKTFDKESSLNVHLRKHTGERPYICSICDKTFSASSNLKTHILTHTIIRAFPCSHCDKSFTTSGSLKQHMRRYSGTRPFNCTMCDQSFMSSFCLKTHIMKHTGEKPFPCSICGKEFLSKYALEQHTRTHTGDKRFKCRLCDKTFSGSSNLKVHLRTHGGEKPFSCSECKKTFSTKFSVEQHIRTHTGEKPFTCTFCGKTFATLSTLNVHQRIHTGQKPFSCTICNKMFTTNSGTKQHMRTHTGERPYICTYCDMTFMSSSTLSKHQQRKHKHV